MRLQLSFEFLTSRFIMRERRRYSSISNFICFCLIFYVQYILKIRKSNFGHFLHPPFASRRIQKMLYSIHPPFLRNIFFFACISVIQILLKVYIIHLIRLFRLLAFLDSLSSPCVRKRKKFAPSQKPYVI